MAPTPIYIYSNTKSFCEYAVLVFDFGDDINGFVCFSNEFQIAYCVFYIFFHAILELKVQFVKFNDI